MHKQNLALAGFILLIASVGHANDWTMGDFMPSPKAKAFVIKVTKSTSASGARKVHTVIGEVRRVIKGTIPRKTVGIVLPVERYKKPPPRGAEVFVMSGSDGSPYTPLWMMHGFVRLDREGRKNPISCAVLSARYVEAKNTAERVSILEQIRLVEQTSCGYEVANRLPKSSCTDTAGPRHFRPEDFDECIREYGGKR